MKTPEGLESAVDFGVIQEVVRPLMSGKEAQIYLVVAGDGGGSECVAKVYKEASQRTFKHRSEYTEGRRTRNSRDQRAMSKRSRHGRSQDEAGWRNTEVDMICRLRDAGVRVPELINFVDGVLVMELVKDADGDPAPRLGDLDFSPSEAREIYQQLVREVVRMLCAGVIHGDLSEFNVLMGARGPVLIDFPQSMDAARNQGARKFLLRDVENLHRFVERYAPGSATLTYGEEMWSLYETNRLEADTPLRGDYRAPDQKADTGEVMSLIEDADRDERARRGAREGGADDEADDYADSAALPRPLRKVVDFGKEAGPGAGKRKGRGPRADANASPRSASRSEARPERHSQGRSQDRKAKQPASTRPAAAAGEAVPKKRRSRRRRKPSAAAGGRAPAEPQARGSGSGSASGPATAGKSTAGSGGGEASNRRRRRGRAGTRSESGPARPGPASQTERPARHEGEARTGERSAPTPGGGDRPPRRRRRRPRTPASRKPS